MNPLAPKLEMPCERLLKYTSPMMYGYDVECVQQRLNSLGFNCDTANGDFNNTTEQAVRSFQSSKGLLVDGVVGANTQNTLFKSDTSGTVPPSGNLVIPIHGREAGYVGDTGLDIAAPKGTDCYVAASGTIIYSEYGHTRWRTPPDTPYSILIKLDEPITFEGRIAHYIWYTHLSELQYTVHEGDGQNIHVNAGDILGKSGLGNNNAHLHFGVIINRAQANSNEEFENKVSALKKEIGMFAESSKSFSPKDVNEITRSCNEILKEILENNQSISSISENILSDSNEFYLTFGNILKIGSTYYRFVEFGNSIIRDGSMIYLYIQIWDEDNVLSLQNLDIIIQTTSSIGEFIYYDLMEIDGIYFANVLSSFQGVESNYLKSLNYKLDNTKLIKVGNNDELTNISKWKFRKCEEDGKCIIEYETNCNYSYTVKDTSIIINALNVDKKTMDSLKIVLSSKGYSFEEIINSTKLNN